MPMFHRMAITALTVVALQLAPTSAIPAYPGGEKHEKPYRLEEIAGSPIKRVVLTPKAVQRTDINTGHMSMDASGKLIAPYLALFYDLKGEAWVYTNPAPLSFVRHKVTVERVSGENVYLADGPPVGTRVVTVGVAELYGTERGIGH